MLFQANIGCVERQGTPLTAAGAERDGVDRPGEFDEETRQTETNGWGCRCKRRHTALVPQGERGDGEDGVWGHDISTDFFGRAYLEGWAAYFTH
jgi:hypothetical protein